MSDIDGLGPGTKKNTGQASQSNIPPTMKGTKNGGITKPKASTRKYPIGSHGDKGAEQKRLGTSRQTHQSEHVVGYHVSANLPRGSSSEARSLEKNAAAYQEELNSHRNHVGTGRGSAADVYRADQRQMVKDGQIGLAVQYNQLQYAHQPEFRSNEQNLKAAQAKADDSYNNMVNNFPDLPDATGNQVVDRKVSPQEQAKMYLARGAARSGKWPNDAQETDAEIRYGLKPSQDENLNKGMQSEDESEGSLC